ncbi:MAG: ATP-binding cassette domain-containing protein [bacterium]
MNKQEKSSMIVLKEITKKFDRLTAVDNLHLEIGQGELFGLLGPNGAGKTTTIGMLTTLIKPTTGKIYINGYDLATDALAVKREIGVAPQHLNLNKDLTAYHNLYFNGRLYKMPHREIKRRAAELLEYVGLTEKADILVEKFSGGMKRRLLIARALMHRPSILFLDEPTVGLDPQTRRKIWDLVKKMHKDGVTILLTTHYIEEAEMLCEKVGIIDRGHLIELATPDQIKKKVGEYTLEYFDGEQKTIRKFFPTRALAIEDAKQLSRNFEIRQSNLEDVFIELTGHRIRE